MVTTLTNEDAELPGEVQNEVAYSDAREWLALMERLGEVHTVRGAHWDREIGAVSEANYRQENPPTLVFDEVQGYPAGFRVVTGSVSTARRLAIALRVGLNETDESLVRALETAPERWERESVNYPPVVVESSPLLENVIEGPDIDLFTFPVPFWHEYDGGRYIGTGCMVITSDPETGKLNGGSYRIQAGPDGRSSTISIAAGKHGSQNVQAWFAKHGRAPVAVTLGSDPLFLVLGGTDVPAGVSEIDYAGAIMGRSVECLKADNGLIFPAGAEIVIEGWLYPERMSPEGPFGEWTGYYSGSSRGAFAFEMTKMYHRNDPMLLGAPPGLPPHDYSYMRSSMKSAMVMDSLRKTGIQGVKGVWSHYAGGGRLLLAVSVEQRYVGHSRQVGLLVSQLPASVYMNRYVIVVDDDVDPRNLDDVMWAVCTRSDPGLDIEVLHKTYGSRADPLVPDGATAYMNKAVIDACVPWDRRDSFPRVARTAPEMLDSVRQKWPELFSGGRRG